MSPVAARVAEGAVGVAVGSALVAQAAGASGARTGVAHALAFRRVLAAGCVLTGAGLLRLGRGGSRPLPAALGSALLAAAAAHGVVLAARARPLPGHRRVGGRPPRPGDPTPHPTGDRPLLRGAEPAVGPTAATPGASHPAGVASRPAVVTVMTFNTLALVEPVTLVRLVERHGPDVLVLPETGAGTARRTAELLATRDRPYRWFAAGGPGALSTALLLAEHLGDYTVTELDPPTRMGTLVARAVDPSSPLPVVVAAHPEAPGALRLMDRWRSEGERLVAAVKAEPGLVLAGDLNATLDHPWLRRPGPAVDAARAVGHGDHGTWPAAVPSAVSTPIDHVLVDTRAWRVVEHRVLPATGRSDHRPVLVRITPRAVDAAPEPRAVP
ncbi:endonuclease/exonuclease/phosphatase family protein [Cellulomonas endophytica]|uniref:endonuclease/exonuclease/phosphatase family protein n=1 Tax=Cellulomonas endophytica TaxID=2494735 RepID=UPI00101346E8|nr:endonuclease/exonuclease/phosphatase family protein [Cellulomonas endophytica]